MGKFKDYLLEYEIHHDGHGNYRDDEGNEWTSKTGSAHRSSFGRRHTITSDHPHSVHINGKKWKTFGSASHASNVAKKIKGATVHREEVEHIDELSDTTLMNYAQKVHDDSLKHDKDPSKRSAAKRSKSVMGFSRALNKLESRPHKEHADMCNVCGQTPCNCTHISESYEQAEEHKNKASKALETSDMESYHHHMSQHHEHMGQWHESKGRHSAADREYAKAEEHHKKGINASKAPSRSLKSTNEQTISEAGAYEKDMDEKKPVTAQGVKGMKSKPFTKHFKTLKHFHDWADSEKSGDHEVHRVYQKEEVEINELSSELLDRYKKKAGLAASAADKAKKYDLGHKRFKGIIKATFKQFANDAKK